MNKLLDNWIFINYCGQKKGQFSDNYVHAGLVNVLLGQIINFFYIPLFYIYVSLGFRAFLPLLILIIAITILARYFLKDLIVRQIKIDQLVKKYKYTTKGKRILYFILSILMTAVSFLIFVFSLSFLGYFAR